MPGLKPWLQDETPLFSPEPDFLVSHTGGPRIMYEVSKGLGIPPARFELSEKSLARRGNTAGVVVFDVLEQTFTEPPGPAPWGWSSPSAPGSPRWP
ncbi:hypothetical protein [Streptomyces netropsis]|uniref:Putative naringenin-chalcone synthase n=1 Tax=Streptomyces netropsis TaxID=55404 RepID=A0A7W7PJG8_STRNE|nr:hypothetical protein [Streptomyces netropsis]MBB4890750.1 putative naringenin-chalcone synthase [Streptomyces netropsis]GGR51442.1 hypothetical protein GCM10010219_65770 [Streptomyces netropsis]